MSKTGLVRHGDGLVLAQERVEQHSNEIPAVQQLLAGPDLQGMVTTCDAQHTQRALAQEIVAQQGDYVLEVKENQPTLYASLEAFFQNPGLPRAEDDRQDYTGHSKGHGPLETRTLVCTVTLCRYLDWPGVQQVSAHLPEGLGQVRQG